MPNDTPPVPRRLRFEILRRDGHTCRYCGASAPDVPLTVDHVIPRALGGSNDPSNLVTACKSCNSGKTSIAPDSPIVADVDAKAMQWSNAMQRATEIRRQELGDIDAIVDQVITYWDGWTNSNGVGVVKDDNWRSSLERFIDAGLDETDLSRMVRVAMESQARLPDKWRYFCGCAWREIERRQTIATGIVDEVETPPGDDVWDNDVHMHSYGVGFNDGREYGREQGFRTGLAQGREEAEAAFDEGFRRGAERLTNYRANLPDEPED